MDTRSQPSVVCGEIPVWPTDNKVYRATVESHNRVLDKGDLINVNYYSRSATIKIPVGVHAKLVTGPASSLGLKKADQMKEARQI